VRVTMALALTAADVAEALTIAWDTFRDAAGDDLAGWEVTAAAACSATRWLGTRAQRPPRPDPPGHPAQPDQIPLYPEPPPGQPPPHPGSRHRKSPDPSCA
jgi:hypothetical protein